MTMVDPGRFPNIVGALREAGLDPITRRVPVAPAAHYVMGGIVTDLDGRTSVERLYAVGECACTGLHGANRLASNSLSECFVFGRRAALAGLDDPEPATGEAIDAAIAPPTPETRAAVWRLAGLERDAPAARASCTRTRTRSPASSPPPPSPARRRAAPTAAPSSPTSTRRSTSATRCSTPTPRPRASRHGRTPDRLGRRPDDEHDGLVRRLQRPRGPRRARRPHTPSATSPTPASALIDLESGDDRRCRSSSAGWPRRSASTRTNLAQAPDRRRASPTTRCSTRSPATTTPASAPRWSRTPGRAPTTTPTCDALFDVVVLSQELGIRKPDAADLHDRAGAPRTPRRALRVRR